MEQVAQGRLLANGRTWRDQVSLALFRRPSLDPLAKKPQKRIFIYVARNSSCSAGLRWVHCRDDRVSLLEVIALAVAALTMISD